MLAENADAAAVETKITAAVEEKWGTLYEQEGISRKYPLQALTDIHLKSNFEAEIAQQGNLQYVYIFSVVAVLVLFIACFNFINLSTARSAKRAKEVGLRKMFGSHRSQLIRQFLNESVLLSLLGMAIGVLLVMLALPAFNRLSGKEFAWSDLTSVPSLVSAADHHMFNRLYRRQFSGICDVIIQSRDNNKRKAGNSEKKQCLPKGFGLDPIFHFHFHDLRSAHNPPAA